MILFTKGTELSIFGQLKIPMKFSMKLNLKTLRFLVNPIIVDGYASLFNCTTAVRASDSMTASS